METLAVYLRIKQKENKEENTHLSDKEELKNTADALDRAWERFNYLTDPDLIESQIFEIRALKSRYSYYLRKIKEHKS